MLLAEVLERLQPREGDTIVDATLGFAGHSAELLTRVGPSGRLIAFDLDPGNLEPARHRLTAIGFPFTLHHGNFAGIAAVLAEQGITQVDGFLADLGMSSMQVDDPERGFSFMRDGPLDMRMDRSRGRTAAELLATLPSDELEAAFRDLGDEPEAAAIAEAIVRERTRQPLTTTAQLKSLIFDAAPVTPIKSPGAGPPEKQKMKPTARVFQALRMLVNREVQNLQNLLRVLPGLLVPGRVAAIISFHSGEDRLVKNAFRDGVRSGQYSEASDEPIRPSEEEKALNPRSRSAKLRWARKA